MSKNEEKTRMTATWRSIHGAVWLIGLAILAWQDWWWPGILVLVAISTVIEALLRQYVPAAYEKVEQTTSPPPTPPLPVQPTQPPPIPEYPVELLPSECPRCGGPIRGHEVIWTGARSADCPFCGANLPLKKNEGQAGE